MSVGNMRPATPAVSAPNRSSAAAVPSRPSVRVIDARVAVRVIADQDAGVAAWRVGGDAPAAQLDVDAEL